jgi:hypothetical protein
MTQRLALWIVLAAGSLAQAAGLDFARTFVEIHAPADAQSVTADFEFANRSGKEVVVKKYDAACSCMAVKIRDGKLRYQPGESGLLRAVFEMGNFSGTVDKTVALWLGDDPDDSPSLTLTVRVHIPVLVALEPKTLHWDLGGDPKPQVIRITMNDTNPIRVTAVHSSSPAFRPELKVLEEGRRYELSVTPTDIGTPGLGILRIETDSPNPKHKHQQAFAVVRKPLAAAAGGKR